jgi:DNA-binding transcriptional LysR family regulator
VARLARGHAGLVVRVRDAIASRVVEPAKAGDVDVGVGCVVRPDPDIDAEPLLTDRLAAFAPAGHLLSRARHVRLRDLGAHPLILTGADTSVRQILERTLAEARLPIQVAQEVTYMSTAIGMVDAGLGVAVLPEAAIGGDAGRRLRRIAIREPELTREVAILTRRGRSRSPATERLVEALRGARRRGTR